MVNLWLSFGLCKNGFITLNESGSCGRDAAASSAGGTVTAGSAHSCLKSPLALFLTLTCCVSARCCCCRWPPDWPPHLRRRAWRTSATASTATWFASKPPPCNRPPTCSPAPRGRRHKRCARWAFDKVQGEPASNRPFSLGCTFCNVVRSHQPKGSEVAFCRLFSRN